MIYQQNKITKTETFIKLYLIDKFNKELILLSNKAKYIKDILDNKIDLSAYDKGIYYVEIISKKQKITKKIVLE